MKKLKKLLPGVAVTMICAMVVASLAFVMFNQDKTYKVELPLKKWIQHNNGLVYIKDQLSNSDLPARQVKFMIDSIITPLQLDMMQVNLQLPKDTTKKQ